MKRHIVESVTSQILKKYPELKGVKPRVHENPIRQDTFTFTFKTDLKTDNGKKISRRIKVEADSSGNILKIVESK